MAERDATASRRAILDAALDEFSRSGFAGARIDRIAQASGRNRALIYAYFESKEGLFAAAFEQVVERVTSTVPLDADDLPGYAVRLFDDMQHDPVPTRLAAWDRLERGGAGLQHPLVLDTNAAKVAAIATAQRAGRVSDRIDAESLLDVVVALSRLHGREVEGDATPEGLDARRTAIRTAVAAVVTP